MSELSEATRAQAEDAIRVLDAIIARDAAHEVWLDAATGDATASAWKVWEQAIEHAQHQITLYRARYGASR